MAKSLTKTDAPLEGDVQLPKREIAFPPIKQKMECIVCGAEANATFEPSCDCHAGFKSKTQKALEFAIRTGTPQFDRSLNKPASAEERRSAPNSRCPVMGHLNLNVSPAATARAIRQPSRPHHRRRTRLPTVSAFPGYLIRGSGKASRPRCRAIRPKPSSGGSSTSIAG